MSQEQEIRYLGDVQRLELAPNDVVVLMVERPITPEIAERLKEHLRDVLGNDRKYLVLSEGIKIGVLADKE